MERAPLDSEYAREKLGEQAQWSTTEHLLATLIDVTQIGVWQFAAAHSPRRAPDKPKPIPRPGQQSKRPQNRTRLSDNEITRRLVDMKRKQEREQARG